MSLLSKTKKAKATKKEPPSPVTEQKRLAAIAYGEASPANNPDEMGGIAWATANRARAWGNKTIEQMVQKDPNYTFADDGKNERYNKLINAGEKELAADEGMSQAMAIAAQALANNGTDPSNGAYWWDGKDFKYNYRGHPKVREGFRFSDPAHNLFDLEEKCVLRIKYKNIRNKKTKKVTKEEVSRYTYKWESTAAHGETIFWKLSDEYLNFSKAKAYR
jgi:hypothetical protein